MPWRVPESLSLPLPSRRCMRGLNKPTIRTSICSPPLSPLNNNIKRAAFFRLGYRKFPSAAAFSTSIPRFLPSSNMASATSFYDFKPLDKRGQEVPLADYKGKVVLIVNTASKCGFTPQYAGLEKLWTDIKGKHPDDFVILGFPCNQFGAQEPGSDEEIQSFCQVNYGVTFPIMQKTEVNGDGTNPLWASSASSGTLKSSSSDATERSRAAGPAPPSPSPSRSPSSTLSLRRSRLEWCD
ncbi:Glutathione peroxidase 2, variant 2 [Fusarium solani]|nr:Glutathione peroxidase 2, variant 2 [Fusarium solani]